jgi:ABC transport system ATP-binding/permease protein
VRTAAPTPPARRPVAAARDPGTAETAVRRPATKLSYKESRELAELPATIEALEREQRQIGERMSRPDYHREGAAQTRADGLRVAEIESQLAAAFDRWAEIEARVTGAKPA